MLETTPKFLDIRVFSVEVIECEICGASPATGEFPDLVLCAACRESFNGHPETNHPNLVKRDPCVDKIEFLERIDANRPEWHARVYGGGSPKEKTEEEKQKIQFENLGAWSGWNDGNSPPYWNDLRLYVFRRDKFKCQKCRKTFGRSKLACHHMIPKEEGGSDSSRNLVTLCRKCHLDFSPIFPESEVENE